MIRLPSHAAFGLAVVVVCLPLISTITAADPPAVTWKSDYNTARKEAQEQGKLIVLVVGTDDCIYCRKQEATTFRNNTVHGLIQDHFLAVKIDANRDPNLAQALKVQLYPTTVIAGPDGKILAYLQGYVSPEQFQEHANRAVLQATTPDAPIKLLEEANKAVVSSDNIRAIVLLKAVLKDPKSEAVHQKASVMLTTLETAADDKLNRAKRLEEAGDASASVTQLTEIVRGYAGTAAAAEAATLLVAPHQGSWTARLADKRVKDLLASAKEDYQAKRYAICLEKCHLVSGQHPGTPEAAQAKALTDSIQNEPELMLAVCEQMNDRTSGLYLALAETWIAKGDYKKAQVCFERVLRLNPGSKTADVAQLRLTNLQVGAVTAIPSSREK